jgi:hypothetical protein
VNDLNATGLAASANLYLSLDDNGAANLGCGSFGFCWSVCGESLKYWYAVLLEKVTRLIFK